MILVNSGINIYLSIIIYNSLYIIALLGMGEGINNRKNNYTIKQRIIISGLSFSFFILLLPFAGRTMWFTEINFKTILSIFLGITIGAFLYLKIILKFIEFILTSNNKE